MSAAATQTTTFEEISMATVGLLGPARMPLAVRGKYFDSVDMYNTSQPTLAAMSSVDHFNVPILVTSSLMSALVDPYSLGLTALQPLSASMSAGCYNALPPLFYWLGVNGVNFWCQWCNGLVSMV